MFSQKTLSFLVYGYFDHPFAKSLINLFKKNCRCSSNVFGQLLLPRYAIGAWKDRERGRNREREGERKKEIKREIGRKTEEKVWERKKEREREVKRERKEIDR